MINMQLSLTLFVDNIQPQSSCIKNSLNVQVLCENYILYNIVFSQSIMSPTSTTSSKRYSRIFDGKFTVQVIIYYTLSIISLDPPDLDIPQSDTDVLRSSRVWSPSLSAICVLGFYWASSLLYLQRCFHFTRIEQLAIMKEAQVCLLNSQRATHIVEEFALNRKDQQGMLYSSCSTIITLWTPFTSKWFSRSRHLLLLSVDSKMRMRINDLQHTGRPRMGSFSAVTALVDTWRWRWGGWLSNSGKHRPHGEFPFQ